VKLLNLNIQAR